MFCSAYFFPSLVARTSRTRNLIVFHSSTQKIMNNNGKVFPQPPQPPPVSIPDDAAMMRFNTILFPIETLLSVASNSNIIDAFFLHTSAQPQHFATIICLMSFFRSPRGRASAQKQFISHFSHFSNSPTSSPSTFHGNTSGHLPSVLGAPTFPPGMNDPRPALRHRLRGNVGNVVVLIQNAIRIVRYVTLRIPTASTMLCTTPVSFQCARRTPCTRSPRRSPSSWRLPSGLG